MKTYDLVPVSDLHPGDFLDLEGDKFADPERADPGAMCEWQEVTSIERETADCIRVDFADHNSVGFPVSHSVKARITPVLFRASGRGKDREITAVFPCEPGTYDGNTMSCYVHVGQHGSCSFEWYYGSHIARETEYAELKAELERAPYFYRFRVYRRLNRYLRAEFDKELRRMKKGAAA